MHTHRAEPAALSLAEPADDSVTWASVAQCRSLPGSSPPGSRERRGSGRPAQPAPLAPCARSMPSLPSRALVPHVPPVQDAGAAGRTGREEKGAVEENGVTDDVRADPGQTGAQTPGTSARVPPQAPVPCEPQEAADPQTGFAGASRAGQRVVGGPPSRPYLVAPRRAASGGDLPFGVTAATCTSGGDPDFQLTPLPFP